MVCYDFEVTRLISATHVGENVTRGGRTWTAYARDVLLKDAGCVKGQIRVSLPNQTTCGNCELSSSCDIKAEV